MSGSDPSSHPFSRMEDQLPNFQPADLVPESHVTMQPKKTRTSLWQNLFHSAKETISTPPAPVHEETICSGNEEREFCSSSRTWIDRLNPFSSKKRRNLMRRHFTFFFIPTIMCIAFVLIPIRLKPGLYSDLGEKPKLYASYSMYIILQLSYYVHAYFTWILVFDYVIPGCPKWMVVLFSCIFFVLQVAALLSFGLFHVWKNKLMFLICGGIETLTGFGLVIVYTLWISFSHWRNRQHNMKKATSGSDSSLDALKEPLNSGSEEQFSSDLLISDDWGVDTPDAADVDRALLEDGAIPCKSSKQPGKSECNYLYCSKVKCWSEVIVRSICYICVGTSSFNPRAKSAHSHTRQNFRAMASRLFGQIVFKVTVFGAWFFLQWFAGVFAGASTRNKRILSAIFQVSRLLFGVAMEASASAFIPQAEVHPVRHLHTLTLNFFFALFYRNLFLEVRDWGTFSLLILFNVMTQFLQYPLRLLKIVFYIRRLARSLLMKVFCIHCTAPGVYGKFMDKLTYEKHVTNVATSFYLRCIAEYFTFFSFIIFMLVIRYSYNSVFYPSLSGKLDDDTLRWLVLQLVILFVVELGKTLVINFICRWILKDQPVCRRGILMKGYRETIYDNATWFLYTCFFVHYLHDIYIATQAVPDEYVWLFSVPKSMQ